MAQTLETKKGSRLSMPHARSTTITIPGLGRIVAPVFTEDEEEARIEERIEEKRSAIWGSAARLCGVHLRQFIELFGWDFEQASFIFGLPAFQLKKTAAYSGEIGDRRVSHQLRKLLSVCAQVMELYRLHCVERARQKQRHISAALIGRELRYEKKKHQQASANRRKREESDGRRGEKRNAKSSSAPSDGQPEDEGGRILSDRLERIRSRRQRKQSETSFDSLTWGPGPEIKRLQEGIKAALGDPRNRYERKIIQQEAERVFERIRNRSYLLGR